MARWTLLAAALTLVACSSSSSDLCTNGINASAKVVNQVDTCDGQPTISSLEISGLIAACQAEIMSCTSQDQTALSNAETCFQSLPPVQCSWFADGGASIPDGGASQFEAQAMKCQPTLSSGCKVAFTTSF